MKRRLWLLLLLAGIALGLGISLVYDPFLDRIIRPPTENQSYVYLDQLNSIAPIIGKKVIFPPGLVEYASKENLHLPGLRIGPFRTEKYIFTIQDYLNERRIVVGLQGKYDPAHDVVVFDFPWHQPVSRSGKELVEQIGKSSPAPLVGQTSEGKLDDPWREALDELMSEPENFPHAWKVRLEGCCTYPGVMSEACSFSDIYGHILKDTDGKDHLLILNYHSLTPTPGPNPSFSYYLFAADGKWEDGGLFEAADVFTHPKVLFGPERAVIESVYGGETYDYTLAINHGKVLPTLSKNGGIVSPSEYEQGITPLRHLGD